MNHYRLFISIILSLILFTSCNLGTPKLYYKTVEVYTNTVGEKVRDTTLNVISDEYFEIKLSSYSSGLNWGASMNLKAGTKDNIKTFRYMYIVDNNYDEIRYDTPADFLNFMAERNYEMVDQTKKKYAIDYTFRKNQ